MIGLARQANWCRSGTSIVGLTNHCLLDLRLALTMAKNLWLGRLYALGGCMLLLFCQEDTVVNQFLVIYHYNHRLLTILIKNRYIEI